MMNVDGNTITVLAAAVAVVGAVVGAAWTVGRKVVRAELALEQLAAKVLALEALFPKVRELELNHGHHVNNDSAAFTAVQHSIDGLTKKVDEMSERLLDVLVAMKLRGRDGKSERDS